MIFHKWIIDLRQIESKNKTHDKTLLKKTAKTTLFILLFVGFWGFIITKISTNNKEGVLNDQLNYERGIR